MRMASGFRLFSLEQLVVHGAHDRWVAHRTVVHQDAVNRCDRVQKTSRLDLLNDLHVALACLSGLDVVVEHLCVVAVAALDLGADYRSDLLRRP